MVSEFARESAVSCKFGHLRYLYSPSRLKLSPLVTVKLLSSPKLKEPELVRLRMNNCAMLRNSVYFCIHFFATNSPVLHIWCIQIFSAPPRTIMPSASHYRALRIDLTVRATFSTQSILCVPFCQSLPQIHRILCALLPFAFATASYNCISRDYRIASVTHAGPSVCTDFCS